MNPTDKPSQRDGEEADRFLDAERRLLLDAVVHDLQSGLQGLMVAADELVREASTNDLNARRISKGAREILAIGEMLAAMTNNLRSGPLPRPSGPIDADGVIREVVALLSSRAESINIEVQALRDDSNRMVMASEPLLRQVVYNLVDNAIKYSHRTSGHRSTVRVILRQTEKQIEVEVQNVASPIDSEDIQRLFEVGYRSRADRQQAPLGTGLGLYVSKKALMTQGGSLEIISQPGSGLALIRTVARLPIERGII
jgi:signal transduction histidine kinase